MNTRIRDLAIEKTTADDADYFLGDDPSGATYKISKHNLFTGITASGGGGGYLLPNTVLIANYQTDFSDFLNHSFSIVGSPVISSDKSPYSGGSSLYLPGNSYLQYTANSDFQLNADWMVQAYAWLPNAYATNNTYAGILNINGGGMDISLGLVRSGYNNNGIFKQLYAQIYAPGQNVEATCNSIASANFETWNHLAAIKINNMLYFFLNGIFQSSASFSPYKFASDPIIKVGIFSSIPAITGGYIAGIKVQSSGIKLPTLPFTE